MTTTIRNLVGYGVTRPRTDSTLRNIFGYAITSPDTVIDPPWHRTDYRKPEKELIFDLLKRDNPLFAAKNPTAASVSFGTLSAVTPTPSNPDDTKVRVGAGTDGMFIGTREVTYRRIDLTKLFRGRVLEITKYQVSNTLAYADAIALIAEQLGVNIDPASVTAASFTADTPRLVTILGTSLCYKGSFTVVWRKGKRNLSEMFTDNLLDCRVWPQGFIDRGDGAKPQGEYIAYDLDLTGTPAAGQMAGRPIGALTGAGSSATITTNNLRELIPSIDWKVADFTEPGGWMGLTIQRYTLPNAAVPEANSGLFNRCVVLSVPAGKSGAWFYGKLMFYWRA